MTMRPTTIFLGARSTMMGHHSRGPPVVSSLVAGSPVWSVTNKCVNRVSKELMDILEWKSNPGDPATINRNPSQPWNRLCRSELPAIASSIVHCLPTYISKIKRTFLRLLSNATRTRSLDTWEDRPDRSCQMMRRRSPGLSIRLLCQFQRNNKTAKRWEQ